MAEPEIATKAPESDAQEAAPSHETAPALSEHCTSDRPTPAGQASTGEITKLGGVDSYVSKPSDYPHVPARLLLFLTGGTGLHSVNNQIQADRFAAEGYVVVMPDLFDGDPAPSSAAAIPDDLEAGGGSSILDVFKTKAAETAKSFVIDMWLARHTEDKVLPLLHKVMDACRDEFADAVSHGGGLYAVGYCFGGRYVLLLAAEKAVRQPRQGLQALWPGAQQQQQQQPQQQQQQQESADVEGAQPQTDGPHIRAGAVAHATLVSKDDFVGLKAPVSLVCVESDPMFPDDVRTAGEDYMSKNNVEHEVQVYPGVPHGFAVVGEYDNDNIRGAQATAFEQMLNWVKEH